MSKGRQLKGQITGDHDVLSREEVLRILSEMAQKGSVSAAIALERALRLEDPDDEKTPSRTSSNESFAVASSVYEDREFGWRDRLRRLLRREDRSGSELIVNEDGNPQLVTSRGRVIGLRRRDGSVAPIPEPPVEQWLDSDWGDTEWVLVGGRWRERWR